MDDIKKAAPACCNSRKGQQIQSTGVSGGPSSKKQSIISNVKSKPARVSPFLRFGEDGAIPSKQLADITGFSERRLRSVIAEEREDGVLILSSDAGYYLPDVSSEKGRLEILHFINTMKQRAFHSLRAIKAAKEALKIAEGQESIDLGP